MMSVRCIIAGGRDFVPSEGCLDRTISMVKQLQVTEIVSGGARGADRFGEQVAEAMKLPVQRFIPEWDRLGKSAGYIRNEAMADYALESSKPLLIAFPGGKGTGHMIDIARRKNIMFILLDREGNQKFWEA